MTNPFTITAIERDGLSTRVLTIMLDLLEEDIDIMSAIKEATREYILYTDEGRRTYAYNCHQFNWADFDANVPNEICEKHGFRKVDSAINNVDVDWDAQLMDEPSLRVTNIQWDTSEDNEPARSPEELNLPTECIIPFRELVYDEESTDVVDVNDLKDRVPDYLSDEYGFCIFGCDIT